MIVLYQKRLLLALLAATSGIALFANPENYGQDKSYIPLISEDKVWEYYGATPWTNEGKKILRMQFKGTSEINGKEYHNLVVTYCFYADPYMNRFKYRIQKEAGVENLDPSMCSNSVEELFEGEETIAFMREENGKCYMLLNRPEYDGNSEDEWKWWLDKHVVWRAIEDNKKYYYGSNENEYLIYDFSLLSSGIIDQFANLEGEALEIERERKSGPCDKVRWNYDPDYRWDQNRIYQHSKVHLDYDPEGTERISQSTDRGTFIEGIGGVEAYLPFPDARMLSDIGHDAGRDPYLNNVYDLEGNIIYKGRDVKLDLANPWTSVDETDVSSSGQSDIYSIDGQLVRRNAESTDGLEKGIYIFRGKKVLVR